MHEVCLAYAHFEDVKAITLNCLDDMRTYDSGGPKLIGPKLTFQASSLGLVSGINQISAAFLDDTDAEWILWVDCDMGFPPHALHQLYEAADAQERPCVSALAFKCSQVEQDGAGGYITEAIPVIMDWGVGDDGQQGFMCRRNYPENALIQCQATGMAFTLIHRRVYEAIRERFGDEWHTPVQAPRSTKIGTFTPDVSFWYRAAECGFPLFVHTGVGTSHQKTTWVSHASYVRQVGEAWRATPSDNVTVMDLDAKPNRAERRAKARAGA